MAQIIFYKPEEAFTIQDSTISLKQYGDDLSSLFLSDNASFSLAKSDSIPTPTITGDIALEDFGPFGGSTKKTVVKGNLEYYYKNFQNFLYGTINLHVKTERVGEGISEQSLVGVSSLSSNILPYAIAIDVEKTTGIEHYEIEIFLESTNTLSNQLYDIWSSLRNALGYNETTESTFPHPVNVSIRGNDLVFYTNYEGDKLEISEVQDLENFIDLKTLFSSVSTPIYKNVPSEDITFFSLDGDLAYINLTHKLDGNIWIKFEGDTERILCPWNKTAQEWMELEISFSENIIFCFQNGKMVNVLNTNGILREAPETSLILYGTETDPYSFGQIAFYNSVKHTKNYIPSTSPIGLYPTNNPYIEIHYGALRTYDDKSISTDYNGSLGVSLYSGSRIIIGGDTYESSIPLENFPTLFSQEELNDYSDLIFKVFFHSDGYTPATLTSLDLNIGTEILEEDSTNPANFNQVFDFIRRSLGYPRVPVELTDDQLLDALNQSVFQYNRYRNYDVNMEIHNTATLERHVDGGFYLPPGIGKDDIIEILFRPRYSWSWYSGDNSLMANIYMQNLFSGFDLSRSAADYYINITTQNDLKNLLGNQSGWHIMNGRLYLFPVFEGIETMNIGIKYRETISIEEINTNVQIQQLALAYAKITLGTIRSTFGDQIPGGDAMVQLNGNSLIQQGQAERDMLIQEFMKQQPVFGFMWT
jgi:hypothetical protein